MTVQGYVLPNAWELAERRLALLEQCHDEGSFRRAAALGIGPGWDCLDAGAGRGSFARWLAARARSVLAVDIDARLLAGVAAPNLEVRELDVAAEELPREAFDLVHTRLLLIHVPQRDAVLRKLVAALRPGGVLLVEEDDVYPIRATEDGPYREAWEAFLAMTAAAGLADEWARGLPEQLDALGLAGVEAELDGQLFRGGSAPAEFWSLTWLQARDRIAALGIAPEVVDRGREALADDRRWYHGPVKVVAWGRRPTPE
jgi:SAM-dependent methyltransferase